MIRPFMIFALPRSRTAWLAEFLSYGGWKCWHEIAIQMRDFSEVPAFFSREMTGAAETAAGPGWRLMHHHFPEMRKVVVRRPVSDVVEAIMRMDVGGVATYDRDRLVSIMSRCRRELDALSAVPGVLTVDFDDLKREDVCAAVFEHCLPFAFDRTWWEGLRFRNIQVVMRDVLLYYYANKDGVEGFKRSCKRELRRLAYAGELVKVA
jgi:hypothetical protein